jgi:hypothetical protein
MKLIHALVMVGLLSGTVAVAEPIDRAKMWTDIEVDDQARIWGDEVGQDRSALAQRQSLAKWRTDIENSDQLPIAERIELLIGALDKISRFSNYQVGERIERRIQAASAIGGGAVKMSFGVA